MAKSEAARAYQRKKRRELSGHSHWGITPFDRVDVNDLRERFAEIPKYDTRDLTALICGDPLPGRSALDRRPA